MNHGHLFFLILQMIERPVGKLSALRKYFSDIKITFKIVLVNLFGNRSPVWVLNNFSFTLVNMAAGKRKKLKCIGQQKKVFILRGRSVLWESEYRASELQTFSLAFQW